MIVEDTIRVYLWLICFGTQADEFEETGGGAEDDAADQEPGLSSEPLVQKPAQGAKNGD